MLLFAASALQKASALPSSFWLKLALCLVGFIVAVLLLRWLAGVNKILMAVVALMIVSITGFQWIYERNEPEFLTPVVEKIAPFFPSKGAYGEVQGRDPSAPGQKKPKPTPVKR